MSLLLYACMHYFSMEISNTVFDILQSKEGSEMVNCLVTNTLKPIWECFYLIAAAWKPPSGSDDTACRLCLGLVQL